MAMRMTPPRIEALSENFVPNFLPITNPAMQIKKVITAMMRDAVSAMTKPYSAMVKPTDKASMEVATPCTISVPKPSFVFSDSLNHHLSADKGKKYQGNPRDKRFECMEILHDRVNADPSGHRHQRLKESEDTGNPTGFAFPHVRLIQAVRKRYRKGIHGKSHPKQGAVQEK